MIRVKVWLNFYEVWNMYVYITPEVYNPQQWVDFDVASMSILSINKLNVVLYKYFYLLLCCVRGHSLEVTVSNFYTFGVLWKKGTVFL